MKLDHDTCLQHTSFCLGKRACPNTPQIMGMFSLSGISESTEVFLFVSARTSCVSCVSTDFFPNGLSLLVYTHLNLEGFFFFPSICKSHFHENDISTIWIYVALDRDC